MLWLSILSSVLPHAVSGRAVFGSGRPLFESKADGTATALTRFGQTGRSGSDRVLWAATGGPAVRQWEGIDIGVRTGFSQGRLEPPR